MKQSNVKIVDNMLIAADVNYKTSIIAVRDNKTAAFTPYKDRNLITRILREIWFRVGLPENVWYNKEILKYASEAISVYDCLITKGFLMWLLENYPDSRITFDYCNLVGRSRHIHPDQIPDKIQATTYDKGDSEKYGMFFRSGGEFSSEHLREKQPIEYDVFYVGADKGRGEYLLELKRKFEEMNLRVKMIITADGRFAKRKKYYSKAIPYDQVLDYDSKSKAILNIILPGQVGATQRDYEALFLKAKLITNNKKARYFDFYKEENVFILGERPLDELPQFLEADFCPVKEEILEKHLHRSVNG